MNIDPQQVHTLEVTFDAGNLVPPPYHYAYQLQVKLAEKDVPSLFEINYLHRDDLSEEEIFDEGFTKEDDWRWKGNLPSNWKAAIEGQINKHSWPKRPGKADTDESLLSISLLDASGQKLYEGLPADKSSWEYFLQELLQAIYEVGGKEAPFQVDYREIASGNEQLDIRLEASFAQQSISARKLVNGKEEETANPDWKELKHLMRLIYLPDYDYDKARVQEPSKRGKYLLTGEGLWFKFGESLLEPDKKSTSLNRLEKELKGLF